jgi:hypothetical protein
MAPNAKRRITIVMVPHRDKEISLSSIGPFPGPDDDPDDDEEEEDPRAPAAFRPLTALLFSCIWA